MNKNENTGLYVIPGLILLSGIGAALHCRTPYKPRSIFSRFHEIKSKF